MSRQNRRTFLKQGGAIAAGLTAVTGTATADNNGLATSSAEEKIYFTPENRVDGPTAQSGPDTKNLDHLHTWKPGKQTVECDECDRTLLSFNPQTTIYKSRKKDSNGDWHYVYWMWLQSDTDTGDGNGSSLIRSESRVDIKQADEVVTNFDPSSTEKMNQRSKDVGASFGFTLPSGAGFNCSASDTIYVDDGEYGPWTDHVEWGDSGEFGVSIDANNITGRQTLIGTVRTRLDDDWTGINDYLYTRCVAACHKCSDDSWLPILI